MKDYEQEILESSRPDEDALTCINHCLKQLYTDNTHYVEDKISPALTYEELIGTLLQAKDKIDELSEWIEDYEEKFNKIVERR